MVTCRNCGKENPGEAQFCMSCGNALVEVTRAEVRKTVTILFCDVVSSTAMGERLDPESVRRVMEHYFGAMRAVIERHGGTVEKFIGDAVMAVFGVPFVHEDDALRAVRAATEMREAVEVLNREFERNAGVSLAHRIGINTGEVVAADSATGDRIVTGDAVNVAARLEQTAGSKEILLGEATYRLVRDAVDAEGIEPVQARGKAEPIAAFRLIGVVAGAVGVTRRLDAELVGRKSELRLLADAFDRSRRNRTCVLFTVLGPAGIGKSRVVQEFLSTIGENTHILRGRCLSYGDGITYWPIVEMITSAADLVETDAPEVSRAKIAALLDGIPEAHVITERLAQILGHAGTTASPEETFWSVRKLLEALARRAPLVVEFDDLEWAEPTLLDLVEHIANWSRDAPILLLCSTRPDLLDLRPNWGGGKMNAASILLEPLSESETAQLVANLVDGAPISVEAWGPIASGAEGNPLFIEQMVAMLIDDGVLTKTEEGWSVEQNLADVVVPPTIRALLDARLDLLDRDERAIIQRASIEGKIFHRGGVMALCDDPLKNAADRFLNALIRHDLVRPDEGAFGAEPAFRFRHLLIREAAYESLPKETRADLHERFASWLESVAGERLPELEEIIGHHLEQAVGHRRSLGPTNEHADAIARRAAGFLAKAGRRAADRGDSPGSSGLLRRAVDALPEDDDERPKLLCDLAWRLLDVSLLEADEAFTQAIEAARKTADRAIETRAALGQVHTRWTSDPQRTGTEEVRRQAEAAIEVLDATGDDLGLAYAWSILSNTEYMPMRYGRCAAALEHAIIHGERAGEQAALGSILGNLCLAQLYGPTPVHEGIASCESILVHPRGNRRTEETALISLAGFHAQLGRFDRARQMLEDAQTIFQDLGLEPSADSAGHEVGCFIESLAGDYEAAERATARGYEFMEAAGALGNLSTIAANRARANIALGRVKEAERFVEIAVRTGAVDDVATQSRRLLVQALLSAGRGEFGEAERLARESLEKLEIGDMLNDQGSALMDLSEILWLAGRLSEASEAARQALDRFERKGNVVSSARVREVLADRGE